MTSNGNPSAGGGDEPWPNSGLDGVDETDDPTLGGENTWTQVAQSHFDPEAEQDLTTAIVTTIAMAEGVDPIELDSPVLYDVVDAPAIQQSLFGPMKNGRSATGSTEFRYDEYLVKVRSDGWILVYE